MCAPKVCLITNTNAYNLPQQFTNEINSQAGPIIIGTNVWIGAGAIIAPNVTIEDGCIIAAGSMIYQDIPANSL
ncbi:MAG: hypothetical protein OMM_13551, partial [Candidatus Magnetoglobus multicellularis str. Araruama]